MCKTLEDIITEQSHSYLKLSEMIMVTAVGARIQGPGLVLTASPTTDVSINNALEDGSWSWGRGTASSSLLRTRDKNEINDREGETS